MDHSIRVSGWMVRPMGKVGSFIRMETSIRVSGRMIKHMDRVCTDILTERFTRAIGKKISSMVKERRRGLTKQNIMVISLMVKRVGMESLPGQITRAMSASSSTTTSMEMVSTSGLINAPTTEVGKTTR